MVGIKCCVALGGFRVSILLDYCEIEVNRSKVVSCSCVDVNDDDGDAAQIVLYRSNV